MDYLIAARQEFDAGNLGACEQFCQSALAENPVSVPALQMLSDIYVARRDFLRARLILTRLLQAWPQQQDPTPIHMNLGLACKELDDWPAAMTAFEEVLKRHPHNVVTLALVATTASYLGQVDTAYSYTARLMEILESSPDNFLVNYRHVTPAILLASKIVEDCDLESWLNTVQRVSEDSAYQELSTDVAFRFGHAAFLEKARDYAGALEKFDQANAAKRKTSQFDVEPMLDTYRYIVEIFDGTFFSKDFKVATRTSDPIPIFIVGMPRSGTSLLEQVLASHSAVTALGEVKFLGDGVERLVAVLQREKPGADYLDGLSAEHFTQLRQRYLKQAALPHGCRYFTDKLPDNINYVWAIVKAFPEARVLCTSREKFATVMSCYTAGFKDYKFCESLEDCASCYEEVVNLSRHWLRVAGDNIKQVVYEELVAEPRDQISALLDFVGLHEEEACFHPERLERGVITASSLQVKRPIYRDGNSRWHGYRSVLGEDLLRLLEHESIQGAAD